MIRDIFMGKAFIRAMKITGFTTIRILLIIDEFKGNLMVKAAFEIGPVRL